MAGLSESEARAQLLSAILNIWQEKHWLDSDDFAVRLTSELMSRRAMSKKAISAIISSIQTTFYRANKVAKIDVVDAIADGIGNRIEVYVSAGRLQRITLKELFPKTEMIDEKKAEQRLRDFQGPEKNLQDMLRVIFRRRGAPLPKRGHDSVKEVADIEYFVLEIDHAKATFAVIVKGFRSTGKKKLTWKDIAHQVTKARRGNPDFILVFSAIEPVDELITSIEEFNNDISKPGCVMFVPPVDSARVLIASGF